MIVILHVGIHRRCMWCEPNKSATIWLRCLNVPNCGVRSKRASATRRNGRSNQRRTQLLGKNMTSEVEDAFYGLSGWRMKEVYQHRKVARTSRLVGYNRSRNEYM
jgi:hypothetical protein